MRYKSCSVLSFQFISFGLSPLQLVKGWCVMMEPDLMNIHVNVNVDKEGGIISSQKNVMVSQNGCTLSV